MLEKTEKYYTRAVNDKFDTAVNGAVLQPPHLEKKRKGNGWLGVPTN